MSGPLSWCPRFRFGGPGVCFVFPWRASRGPPGCFQGVSGARAWVGAARRSDWLLRLLVHVGVCACVVQERGAVEQAFDDVGHANWCPFRLDSPCLGVCIVKPSARGGQPQQKGSQQ
nr:MAG TPA: hypothetical protein [Caudoviricetes sp.]